MKTKGIGLLLVAAFLVCHLVPNPASAFTREEEQRIFRQLDQLQQGQQDLAERVARMEGQLDGMDKRLDSMDKRLDSMDKRLDGMDKRLDGQDSRLDSLERHIDRMVNIMLAMLGLIGILMGFTFWFARKDFALANRHTTEMTGLKQRLDRVETDFGRLRGAKG